MLPELNFEIEVCNSTEQLIYPTKKKQTKNMTLVVYGTNKRRIKDT